MSLFSKKGGPSVLAIFDIDSTGVGVFVVDAGIDRSTVLFSHREELPVRTSFSSAEALAGIEAIIRELAPRVIAVVGKIPERIIAVLSSPYSAAQTRFIKESYPKPTTITEKILLKLIQKNIDEFSKTELVAYGEAGGAAMHTIIETNVMRFRLNGYQTDTPIGKEGSELEVALYASIIPAELEARLTDLFRSLFHKKPLEIHSRAFALFNAFRHRLGDESYVFIDITGEMTDVTIIDRGTMIDTMSFPLGRNIIIRTVAERFAIPIEAAASKLALGLSDMQHAGAREKVDAVMHEAGTRWVAGLCEAFAASSDQYLLPEHMFLLAEKDSQGFFREFVSGDSFCRFVFTNSAFVVAMLDDARFDEGLVYRDGLAHDPVLAAEFLSLHTLYTQSFSHLM